MTSKYLKTLRQSGKMTNAVTSLSFLKTSGKYNLDNVY